MSITSTTIDAYFAAIVWKPVPTDAITHGHGFELATFNASNLVYRKEQMLAPAPAHMGANQVFAQSETDAGREGELGNFKISTKRRSRGTGVVV